MGPLGQAIVNGVVVAMAIALAFLVLSYPDGKRLAIALVAGTITGIVTFVRARRA